MDKEKGFNVVSAAYGVGVALFSWGLVTVILKGVEAAANEDWTLFVFGDFEKLLFASVFAAPIALGLRLLRWDRASLDARDAVRTATKKEPEANAS